MTLFPDSRPLAETCGLISVMQWNCIYLVVMQQHQCYVSLQRTASSGIQGATMLCVVTYGRAMSSYKFCNRQFKSRMCIKHNSEMQFRAHKSSNFSTVNVAQSLSLCLVLLSTSILLFCVCCPTENICDAKHGWHLATHNALCHGPTFQCQLSYRDKRCLEWPRAPWVRSLGVKTYFLTHSSMDIYWPSDMDTLCRILATARHTLQVDQPSALYDCVPLPQLNDHDYELASSLLLRLYAYNPTLPHVI